MDATELNEPLKAMLNRIVLQFTQPGDSLGGPDVQELEMSLGDAGGGPFIVLKTERWAIDSRDDLAMIFDLAEKLQKSMEELNGDDVT